MTIVTISDIAFCPIALPVTTRSLLGWSVRGIVDIVNSSTPLVIPVPTRSLLGASSHWGLGTSATRIASISASSSGDSLAMRSRVR